MRWIVVAVAACRPAATPTIEPLPPPACQATLVDSHVAVDGKPTTLEVLADPDTKLVTWAHGNGLVLAWTTNAAESVPSGSEDAYAIDCATHAVSALAHVDQADFGHAAADATTLYFTGPDGVRALDLATKQVTQITHAMISDECTGPETVGLDVVTSLAHDQLDFDRFPGCNAWLPGTQTPFRLGHPAGHGEPRPVRPISAVAVEAGGAVWASGPTCQTMQMWRSIDRGEHWTAMTMPDGIAGATAIIADHTRVGRVVVEASYCVEPNVVSGGKLFVTHDAGHDWDPIPLPDDIMLLDADTAGNLALSSRDGSTDELVITANSNDGTLELASWLSTDGGTVWMRMPRPKAAVTTATEAKDGAFVYKPSPDGLVRVHGNKTETFYPL